MQHRVWRALRFGRPELTTQDIAAAIAYVQDGLGRELMEALWWPESASRRREHLRKAVIGLVAPEFIRQMQGLANARTEFGIAKACMGWGGSQVTDAQRRELLRAESALDEARAAAWPNNTMEQLGVLVGAVIAEMASCGCCKACAGTRVQAAPTGSVSLSARHAAAWAWSSSAGASARWRLVRTMRRTAGSGARSMSGCWSACVVRSMLLRSSFRGR